LTKTKLKALLKNVDTGNLLIYDFYRQKWQNKNVTFLLNAQPPSN